MSLTTCAMFYFHMEVVSFAIYGSHSGNTIPHILASFAFSSRSNSFVRVDILPQFMGVFVKADLRSRISIKTSFIY